MADPRASSSTAAPGGDQLAVAQCDFIIVPAHRMWALPFLEFVRRYQAWHQDDANNPIAHTQVIGFVSYTPYDTLKDIIINSGKLQQGMCPSIWVFGVEFRPADRVTLENTFRVTWATENFDAHFGRTEKVLCMSPALKCSSIFKHYRDEHRFGSFDLSSITIKTTGSGVHTDHQQHLENIENDLLEWSRTEIRNRNKERKLRPLTEIMFEHGRRHFLPVETWPEKMEAVALGLCCLESGDIPKLTIGYVPRETMPDDERKRKVKTSTFLDQVSLFHCDNRADLWKVGKWKDDDKSCERFFNKRLDTIEDEIQKVLACGHNIIRQIEMSVRTMIHSGQILIGYPPCYQADRNSVEKPLIAAVFRCSDHIGATSRAVLRALPRIDITVAYHITYRRVKAGDALLKEPRLVVKFRSRGAFCKELFELHRREYPLLDFETSGPPLPIEVGGTTVRLHREAFSG